MKPANKYVWEDATFLEHKNLKGKQQQHCFDHKTGKLTTLRPRATNLWRKDCVQKLLEMVWTWEATL